MADAPSLQAAERAAIARGIAVIGGAQEPSSIPVPDGPQPWTTWRQWLAARGFGLVPIAAAGTFQWPGTWLARLAPAGAEPCWAVMFGSPSGPVEVLCGAYATPHVVEEGWVLAPLDLREPSPTLDDASTDGAAAIIGVVQALLLAPEATAPMVAVQRARLAPGGIEGDRYAAQAGTFSDPHGTGNDVTLVDAAALAASVPPGGVAVTPEEARRNVVTSGIDLDALVGRRFRLGTAECIGRRPCEPCAHLERLTRPGVLRAMVHRGGLRADVLVAGDVAVGDAVRAASPST